jgi:hypothetical protein
MCSFSRRELRILRTVHVEGCVSLRILHTMYVFPLVNLCNLIFEPSVYFCAFLMDFDGVGVLIVFVIDVFLQTLCAMLGMIFQW